MKTPVFGLALTVVLFCNPVDAAGRSGGPASSDFYPVLLPLWRGHFVTFDANTIGTCIRNNGSFDRDPGTGNAGFEWPRGSGKTAIYASGIWLGGKRNDTVCVAVAEYAYEYDAGPIRPNIDPEHPHWRVYKIKPGDHPGNSTDYAQWPHQDGAPYVVSTYGDTLPRLLGDRTIWTVFNDDNPSFHVNMNTPPLGMEVQLTAYAYDRPGALGNAIFYRWRLINRSGVQIDSTYVTIWSDVDLGNSGDDYDGCDTTVDLGFTYNGAPNDAVYGIPPAVGFDLLQGPLVPGAPTDTARLPDGRTFPGMKLLRMTSFVKYNNDQTPLGNPQSGQEVFFYQRGVNRVGSPILDNNYNPIRFMFPGNPELPSGPTNWIETDPPGDRRFMMTTGPFTMAPGDTQEIVASVLIALGTSNRNSVTALKQADSIVQHAYELQAPLIGCSPDSLGAWTVEGDSTLSTLTIGNFGGTSLEWAIATNPTGMKNFSWLSVNPSSGTIAPGRAARVTVTMRAVQPTGTIQQGSLTISSNDTTMSPRSLPVRLSIFRILNVAIEPAWNILSVPLAVPDYGKSVLFPSATTPAYRYHAGSGYTPEDTLENRVGYWLKFPAAEARSIAGLPVDADTFLVEMGWNLIGSISLPIPVDSIRSIPGGMVTGQFYTFSPAGYQVADTVVPGKGYWVKVTQDGSLVLAAIPPPLARIRIRPTDDLPPIPPSVGTAKATDALPKETTLEQNYPNPFNSISNIEMRIADRALVELAVFDLLGRHVATLVRGVKEPGVYSLRWDASGISSGVYFCRLCVSAGDGRSGSVMRTRRLLLVR